MLGSSVVSRGSRVVSRAPPAVMFDEHEAEIVDRFRITDCVQVTTASDDNDSAVCVPVIRVDDVAFST